MIKSLFGISLLLFCGCKVKQSYEPCQLIPSKNIILGNDANAKEFHIPKMTVSGIIEILAFDSDDTNNDHFMQYSKEKFTTYTISGCADTTWAKKTMAEHLMKKYRVNRQDSSYQRTILRVSVIDESKLTYSPDSCEYLISLFNRVDGQLMHTYECIEWGIAANLFLPSEYEPDQYNIKYDEREGIYDLTLPADLVEREGFQAYQKFLKQTYGVSLDIIGMETVQVGIYTYRE